MLRIVTGRAGCGKTGWVLSKMKEEGGNRPQLLLVPEQASFETERRFCQENGNQAGRYGEVLSFSRLENRVLSLAGGGAEEVLDQGGRLLMLYAALKSVSDHLTVYAQPSRKPEFLASLLTTMDELKSYCVTGADLAQVGEDTEGLDGDKLRDLGLIFSAYEAMTSRGKLDPRDRLTRLAEKLRIYPFYKGKDLYIDGFTDFTPQQGLVLTQMLAQSHSVTVCLTCGSGEGEEEVFAPAQRTITWLKQLAQQAACPVEELELPPNAGHRAPALDYLESHLFAQPQIPYEGEKEDSLWVGSLPTQREEVRWAAGEIRSLVQSGAYRYRDIAVAARSMEGYWEHIEGIFLQYDLPVFQADRTDILQKPIFTLITAALDVVTGGYAYEDVFRYLKTGLAGLHLDEVDKLENYALTWNIFGSRWTSPKGWTMHPAGYHKEFTEEDRETLNELNLLRLRVVEPLEDFRKNSGDTIGEQVFSLYRFLENIHAPESLTARTETLLAAGEPELAREYSQLWEIFCGALVQCQAILGETEGELSEFSRLLRLLLSCYSVGSIPASLDRVTAGDAQRIANRRCKVLFLLGADDGSIPQVTPGGGLLTDRDRAILEDYGLEMPPRAEEKLSRESTIVYTVCAQPTEKLYVTWPSGGEGEKRPSFLVERLVTLFPWAEQTCTPAPSPDQLRAMAARSPQARKALEGDDSLSATFRRLDRAAQWSRGRLSSQAVKQLYGEKVAMSASRLDQYKSCHFAYFLRFGLNAQDRRPAGFHAPEYGTFVHFVLEWVLRALQGKDIKEVPGEEITAHTQEAVNAYVLQKLGGMENQTPRFRYLFGRLKKSVQAVVENVTDELRASDFQPIEFELGFGPGKELPPVEVKTGGITLRLSGFVDRVDGWVQDDRLYLRVVDYKTGRKSFDLTEVWNGLGLQMLLYLFTLEKEGARRFGRELVPAGVLYLPARDAVVAGSREMSEAERKKVMDKELTRQGLILEDSQVVEAMEHNEGELRFLPLKIKKGQITGDALVSAERMGKLNTHIQNILHDICREIAAGNIDADPFWRGENKNACQYCEFFRACHFEEKTDQRRWITSMTNKEFWGKLEENEEGGEGHGRKANP